MPSIRSRVGVAVGVALLLTNGALARAPTCTNPQLSCHNTTTVQNTCCVNSPGGQVLQTQFWDTDPATGPANHWTVHGLWPDNCDGTFSSYCDESRQYTNITQILLSYGRSSLLQYMETYWKDDGGDDESFWEHEWGKHGTCYSTLEPSCYVNYTPQEEVVDFFQRTVDLFMKLDTYQFLSDAGIVPTTTKNYTLTEVIAALKKPRGVAPVVQCYKGQLDEVWYFYDVAGTIADGSFVPENPVGETSDCPASFMYLPKNLTSVPTYNDTIPPPPFVGSGYVLIQANGKEVGCLNSAGRLTRAEPGGCATYTGTKTATDVQISSPIEACSIQEGQLLCEPTRPAAASNFTVTAGNLAFKNSMQFHVKSLPAAGGSGQADINVGAPPSGSILLGLTWEATSKEGFTEKRGVEGLNERSRDVRGSRAKGRRTRRA